MDARLAALRILSQIPRQSIRLSLEQQRQQLSPRDYTLTAELCYGVCRHYYSLLYQCQQRLAKPLPDKHRDLLLCLMLAIYQLQHTRIPPYAVVNETLNVVKKIHKAWAVPLLNACLRSHQTISIPPIPPIEELQAYYNHPSWYIKAIQKQYPDYWQTILINNNRRSPLTIRVNAHLISRQQYGSVLHQAGIEFSPSTLCPLALRIRSPLPIHQLPGYEEGWFCVQDSGAQLAAELLNPQPHDKVLDAGAAPGNKSSHLLLLQPTLKLSCADKSDERLKQLQQNLTRMRMPKVQLLHRDLTVKHDREVYDRVLLDVPCSASGMISRYPEIKLKERSLATDSQALMLEHCISALKAGGWLLYVSCSLLAEENQSIIRRQQNRVIIQNIDSYWGLDLSPNPGRQLLPGATHGGFYYCLLQKK